MKIYKVLRWVILVFLGVALALLFRQPNRLYPQQQPAEVVTKNADSFHTKLGELQEAHERGRSGAEARLTSEEVGAAMVVANPRPQGSVSPTAATSSSQNTDLNHSTSLTPEQVPVKDPQVIFTGDEVRGQFAAQVYGKDVFVTLSGHIGAKDGYATFHATRFAIGSLPVPIAMVQAQLDKKLSEPETRDKLKLPEFVSDLRVENGQLVITEK